MLDSDNMLLCCRFQVLNMRDNVTFLLFSNASATNPFSNVTEVAASPVLTMANLNEPLHGHLAVTQTPGWVATALDVLLAARLGSHVI